MISTFIKKRAVMDAVISLVAVSNLRTIRFDDPMASKISRARAMCAAHSTPSQRVHEVHERAAGGFSMLLVY
jgi:hypothetical protein